jgi:uncharacterized protein (DUF736 family)
MGLKRLLNTKEEIVYDLLRKACDADGARVYPKVRVSDVLQTDREGSDLRNFGLRSHFDFTVVDLNHMPLFAVEYDGPSHTVPAQQQRDAKKDSLCRKHELPLLRVTSRHLVVHRRMDLLTWIVNVWFIQDAFYHAQEVGVVPWDEGFDPTSVMTSAHGKSTYPLWFAKPARDAIRVLHRQQCVQDRAPSMAISHAKDGVYVGIAWLHLSKDSAIYATARLRDHEFPVNLADALQQIVELELFEKLKQVLQGISRPLPVSVVNAAIRNFHLQNKPCRAAYVGGFSWRHPA